MSARASLPLLLLLAGCDQPATEIMVIVNSNLGAQLRAVRIVVASAEDSSRTVETPCDCVDGAGCASAPYSFGLIPGDGSSPRFTATAAGFSDLQCGAPLVSQSATVGFVQGQTLALHLDLDADCVGITCPTGQTCSLGACEDESSFQLETLNTQRDLAAAIDLGAADLTHAPRDSARPPDLAAPTTLPDFAMLPDLSMLPDLESSGSDARSSGAGDGFLTNCGDGKCVFVTSVAYFSSLGGLIGADMNCQTLASAAGLTGMYKAWLSDDTASPSSRMTHSANPYYLLDGTVVAENWTDLTSGMIRHPIDLTELHGAPPSTNVCNGADVFSNTDSAGNALTGLPAGDCLNWTGGNGGQGQKATVGAFNQTTFAWTASCSQAGCDGHAALYCFEQ